jgi:methylphosphotriester-DNA--protein-cysteine methyltransferase
LQYSMAYHTDAARWRALATRDANANGHFIYAVKSTNIYCRPTCPARLARRANVDFYKTPLEAEANGFRACKRCRPSTIVEDPQARAVEKACSLIEEAMRNDDQKAIRLQDLAKNVGLTPRYLHKIFKDKMGTTPKEWTKARAQRSQSTSNATPSLILSPADIETPDWVPFNFNELVDFDMDGSATLGYNLATGATEPVSMGYGNSIDVNILYDLWAGGYELNGVDTELCVENTSTIGAAGAMHAPASVWPVIAKQASTVSDFELDADALLRFDGVLF